MKHNISFNVSKNALRTPINIYGSGISGLITAYNFLKIGFIDVKVHTKGRGIIQSEITPHGVVEYAANSILQNKAVTELLNELQIEYEYSSSLGKKKYIFHNGKALKWPLSISESLKSFFNLLGLAFKIDKYRPLKYETVREWGERAVGSTISKRLIQRGLQGIYGPNTGDLSASLCLSSIFDKQKKMSKGSISFKKGMGSFIKILENEVSLMGAQFQNVSEDKSCELPDEGISIVCTPAHSMPGFVKQDFSSIKYHPISIVTLIFEEDKRLPFKGFGCLFNEEESGGILGVINNSDLFDNRSKSNEVSESWILDGRFFSNEEDLKKLNKFREEAFEIQAEPKDSYFKFWPKAFPVYNLELEKQLEGIVVKDNIYFFGNWTGKIGIGRLIEDSPRFIKGILKDLTTKKREI